MTSVSPKSSSARAKPSPAISEAESDGGNKRTRILDAALDLFLRYGVKRTSVDDIVLEAGIAKGTFYLYFASKDAVFAAVAERICADTLVRVRSAILDKKPLVQRLVGLLDIYIGEMHRLIAQSPHVAELTESKEKLAAATYAEFNLQMKALLQSALSEAGVAREGAVEMFLAAALGTVRTGDLAEKPYRARLTAIVETLITGLEHDGRRH